MWFLFFYFCFVPSTDNAIGNKAYVPGDVITMFDGTTVEVLNTDAEGRLLLADGLTYAKKFDPELVIDVATLTGAASAALGHECSAIFTEDDVSDVSTFLEENIQDFEISALSDNTGRQTYIAIVVQEEQTDLLKESLEKYLGEELTQENSSIETTSSALSANFYKQLLVAILLAFFWMAGVVFLIFAKGRKIKTTF